MRIAAVVPAYKCKVHILKVLGKFDSSVEKIYVVDDACPQKTGEFVRANCLDPRVEIIDCDVNQGVGGAMIRGYLRALHDGYDIVVKIDGDEQMDPGLIQRFVRPIRDGRADYTKGNRFFDIDSVARMPAIRIIGNAILSLFSKISSGYWDVIDPNNGYTAIHARVLGILPIDKISNRYFFESDMLFRLNTIRAKVVDVPMVSVYGDEQSNLKIMHIIHEFLFRHVLNFVKRIAYSYYLRGFNFASVSLVLGVALLAFGGSFGVKEWIQSSSLQITASAGTVMLAALPVILGTQMILSFINYDISSVPNDCIHPRL